MKVYRKTKPKPLKEYVLIFKVHRNAPDDTKLTGSYAMCKSKKNELERLDKTSKSFYIIKPK